MEQESFSTLEYEKIRAMLMDCASSKIGKEKAAALVPSADYSEVSEWQSETDEAVRILAMTAPPLGGIRDIRPLVEKVRKNAVLDLGELQDVQSMLYAMRQVKYFFRDLEIDAPMLREMAHGIVVPGQLERDLENAIDEHGGLRDTASVELRRIRTELRGSQTRIKDHMQAILHNADNQKYFQDAIITMRDDRYVIPVKSEYRQRFPGLIHDRSATGSTLYIEPMAIVELNNDIKQLELEERQEVARILRDLSQRVLRNAEDLLGNTEVLAEVDFAFAKAKLAQDMDASRPTLNEEGRTALHSARHPLIDRKKVVPLDITIGRDYRMLLITGPNTGGKTVSMKTLGLMVLMAQSGLYLPCASDSEIAVYANVYADIGDEQSIEQSLSTFSAHMTHIIRILEQVERQDLVLIDELGSGTDPEEGAALAMSILERLLEVGATTVTTTHYSELKTFAYAREGIENACVEFDVKTLMPTYRLLIGIPGASNAFAISERLGLPQSIILRAQQLVKADHAQFEHVVSELEQQKILYEQMNADIRERQERVEKIEAKVEAAREALSKRKGEIIRKAREQSAALVRRTRRDSEEIIEDLKKQFDDQGIHARQQAMQEARRKLNEAMEAARPGIMPQKGVGKKVNLKTIQPGDTVYVKKLDQKGTVLAIDGKELEVQLGNLHTKVRASACTFLSHPKEEQAAPGSRNTRRQSGTYLQKTAQASPEIDIRGMMVNEAEVALGKFLDDAVIAGLGQVLIIHGKGTGALRKGVHAYLARHKNVREFAFADITEGGTGATVVHLK
ncbi:MAG: endonuclease MutS2 [Selenomonadaceae bacterium]|nr:endonuclease MutS2 [Selenomonadaceae bacterium]